MAATEAQKASAKRYRARNIDAVRTADKHRKAAAYKSDTRLWADRKKKLRETINGRATHLLVSARLRAKKSGSECDLTQEWIADRLKRGRCEVSGIPLSLVSEKIGGYAHPCSPSLDRIDSARGYTMDNVVVVCTQVNVAKGAWGFSEFLKMCRAVTAEWQTTIETEGVYEQKTIYH